ncbi:ubiquitin carboxyl-terminal hydrolase 1 [Drosophila kikkawai]|uniref:Ubiquitin carboxyl-terminal hydrolase 1 n=1 Tax=Drosophila kikkawai TaxID=30033 RepID=A0A6P4I6H7_DROKI|nr:ubiquitin carboxyl-terminal hydrolase 1 [Drosophila kikkawai]XP_017023760.1 ubiquitin carboxyl-terminal hydrolase 1 [Drosophila kikkawai]XP_017023761.1 ubiquitin carboxyl-terminal hydrolase 1 [Drosophila kikkawai]
MHEYDVNERKEEPASLPLPSSDTSDTRSTSNSEAPISQHGLQKQTQQEQQEERANSLSLFPEVIELTDCVVGPNPEFVHIGEPQKKRQRRVYVASSTRCASLRSQNKPPPPPPAGEGEVKQQTPSPVSLLPAQAAASPTPTELPLEYIKPELFKPEFWNRIEEQEPEGKPAAKKRRGGPAGGRTRTRRNQILNDLEIYSPETAAAIAAAQAELDAPGKARRGRGRGTGTARGSRRKIDTAATSPTTTMSLYDRRYQSTTDERRGVANGYGATGNNGLRTGNAGNGASEMGESQELSQSSHQYYGSAGGSNPTGAGSGLNGSASAALNHAPSMGTLCNIGNTCYLNSVVYTLRFAPHFLHNLHHLIQDLTVVQQTIMRQQQASKSASLGRNVSVAQLEHARSWSSKDLVAGADQQQQQYSGLNGGGSGAVSSASNANTSCSGKPSHQSVTENLHELYNNLHGNEMADSTEPYHADTLLHAIQDVNATFEGNQQQDAHEFLMCVLNCIRETNQSLIKAIGECPEVIANGYIANPDDVDTGESQDRTDSAASASNNGSLTTTSHITTTKTSFFSRKSKRKDEVKSSKATRIQSPLKDKDNSPTANSLFYLNTVDLTTPPPPAVPQPTKYSSDNDDNNSATLLKDKMRLEERIRELNLNFFSSDFEGIVVLTTKCLSCETVTRQKQGMLDISVPVPISGYDNELQDKQPSTYIQSSCMTKEYFRGENKYSCNQCTGYTEAIRSISYEVLPRLLVIQLNRFSGGMEKVSTYVPTTFTLPCFCAKCCDLAEGHKLHVYKLYSVITHVGATLTVGHYIAYTCFLDLASDYVNCPKDRRNTIMTGTTTQAIAAAAEAENSAPSSTPVAAAASALASSGSNLMKKMKFGRGKTSSSGDLSKNLKQLNGISSKNITNGIGKLSMNNTTCHGVQCCAMRLCCSNSSNSNSASCSDFSEESLQNGSNSNLSSGGSYPTGYGSTGRGGVRANYVHGGPDPIWYMCDDDKIKAMSQREFEELLSPTRKITITPYLLFYARFDLQTPAKPGTSSTTPPPPAQPPGSTQGSSWSNDSSKI